MTQDGFVQVVEMVLMVLTMETHWSTDFKSPHPRERRTSDITGFIL